MSGRIAILGTRGYPSYYGGFETLLRALVPYLAQNGWQVDVYGRRGAVAEEPLPRGVKSILAPGIEYKSTSTLTYGLSASVIAAFKRYDAALVMNVANGYWLPLLKMAGVTTIVNVDGIEWERDKWGKTAKSVFRKGAQFTGKYADQIVTDSNAIAAYWKDTFSRDSTFIPYGGYPPLQQSVAIQNVLELGLEPKKYVLMVARFVPENTIQPFLTAAEQVAETHDVVIVGSSGYGGELDAAVQTLCKKCFRVRWLGQLKDDEKLFSLWQNAGVYFHGHSVGGTNPALVQAMACGAPTVARDTVFNREVLENAGTFVQPQSDLIASAVLSLLDDPVKQKSHSELASKRQSGHYSWAGVCEGYERLLQDAVSARKGRSI